MDMLWINVFLAITGSPGGGKNCPQWRGPSNISSRWSSDNGTYANRDWWPPSELANSAKLFLWWLLWTHFPWRNSVLFGLRHTASGARNGHQPWSNLPTCRPCLLGRYPSVTAHHSSRGHYFLWKGSKMLCLMSILILITSAVFNTDL